jgi:hypothetical protein
VARTTGSYMEILVTEENEVIPCFLNSGPAWVSKFWCWPFLWFPHLCQIWLVWIYIFQYLALPLGPTAMFLPYLYCIICFILCPEPQVTCWQCIFQITPRSVVPLFKPKGLLCVSQPFYICITHTYQLRAHLTLILQYHCFYYFRFPKPGPILNSDEDGPGNGSTASAASFFFWPFHWRRPALKLS